MQMSFVVLIITTKNNEKRRPRTKNSDENAKHETRRKYITYVRKIGIIICKML